MVARIQGFVDEWAFFGAKTAAYRQVGNAFPPPVARVLGERLAIALNGDTRNRSSEDVRAALVAG
jgi:DNA (cytosine-5)-methyltransferase 1